MSDSTAERTIVLLVGPPGAGKGTQASAVSRELGVPHLASGNLFRAAMEAGTPLGNEARQYMERGELVPDGTTIGLVMAELAKPETERGAVLDGFPRTVAQAAALDASLAAQGERVDRVVFIDVPNEELVKRLAGRWVCPTTATSTATSSCSAMTIGPRSSAPVSSSRCRRCARSSTTTRGRALSTGSMACCRSME